MCFQWEHINICVVKDYHLDLNSLAYLFTCQRRAASLFSASLELYFYLLLILPVCKLSSCHLFARLSVCLLVCLWPVSLSAMTSLKYGMKRSFSLLLQMLVDGGGSSKGFQWGDGALWLPPPHPHTLQSIPVMSTPSGPSFKNHTGGKIGLCCLLTCVSVLDWKQCLK